LVETSGPSGHSVYFSVMGCEYCLPDWNIATLGSLRHAICVLSLFCKREPVGWDIATVGT
jgi:hypothetical protein